MSETRKFNAKKYSECFKRFSDLVAFSRLDEYDCDEISKMLELLFETISELNNRVSQLETENNLIKLEVKSLKANPNLGQNND